MAYNVVGILPSAARTVSGNVAIGDIDTGDTLSIQLDVTAQTGTSPTLDVSIQWSMDGVIWSSAATPDTFAQITAAPASVVKTFQVKAPWYRLVYTFGGTATPGYTFSAKSYETT